MRMVLVVGVAAALGFAAPAMANCPPGAICPSGNPYAPGTPIYDQNGTYRGNLSSNPYEFNSTANPYGQYGNRYSPDSLNNPQVQQQLQFGR